MSTQDIQPFSRQISKAWNAPIPEAAEITHLMTATIAAVAAYSIMPYLCDNDLSSSENIRKCFHKPQQFFFPLFIITAGVGAALYGARNLSYRVCHVIQTGSCEIYKRALPMGTS